MASTIKSSLDLPSRLPTQPVGRNNEIARILASTSLQQRLRAVLAQVHLPSERERPFTIGVAAALYDEGTVNLALGLATVLASDGSTRVGVADCDLARPALHQVLELPVGVGLGQAIDGPVARTELLRPTALPNLVALLAGRSAKPRLEAAVNLRQWLTQFRRSGDVGYLVLKLPPVNVDPGARVLAGAADAIVLAVRGGVTPKDAVQAAVGSLAGASLACVVVTNARPAMPGWLRALVGDSGEPKE
jgi:Mrp family chromosome partitioning ATPase